MMPPFTFPVLRVYRQVGRYAKPGQEVVDAIIGDGGFDHSHDWELERHELDGMLFFDSAGRSWKIVSVQDLGEDPTFWDWVFLWYRRPRGLIRRRISCEFAEIEPLALHALKERVCGIIAGNPDRWRDDEAIAGEAGPPRDEQEMLDELQARVRKASSVPQIVDALYDEETPRPDAEGHANGGPAVS